jgi:predicted anti-sigma-YlaC factor YlaD
LDAIRILSSFLAMASSSRSGFAYHSDRENDKTMTLAMNHNISKKNRRNSFWHGRDAFGNQRLLALVFIRH